MVLVRNRGVQFREKLIERHTISVRQGINSGDLLCNRITVLVVDSRVLYTCKLLPEQVFSVPL